MMDASDAKVVSTFSLPSGKGCTAVAFLASFEVEYFLSLGNALLFYTEALHVHGFGTVYG